MSTLRFEVCSYAEWKAQNPTASDQGVVFNFIPSLVSNLIRLRDHLGRPLTRDEVLSIRDRSGGMGVPVADIPLLANGRGYDDFDPELCWEQWQAECASKQ